MFKEPVKVPSWDRTPPLNLPLRGSHVMIRLLMERVWVVNEAFCFSSVSSVLKSNSVIIATFYDSYSRTHSCNNTSGLKVPLEDWESINLPNTCSMMTAMLEKTSEFFCRACVAGQTLVLSREKKIKVAVGDPGLMVSLGMTFFPQIGPQQVGPGLCPERMSEIGLQRKGCLFRTALPEHLVVYNLKNSDSSFFHQATLP